MKYAVDFDGVLALLPKCALPKSKWNLLLDSKHAVQFLQAAPGAVELLSILRATGKASLVTSRPQEHLKALEAWLRRNIPGDIRPKEIICCGSVKKQKMIADGDFQLLIDDKSQHIAGLAEHRKGILWKPARTKELIRNILSIATGHSAIQIGDKNQTHLLKKWREITDRGASSVFQINAGAGKQFKMRLCDSEDQARRIENISTFVMDGSLPGIAHFYRRLGLVVLKEFIPVTNNWVIPVNKYAAKKTGLILAKLHDATLDRDGSVFCCCSADQRNTVWVGGNPMFIDLGCCIQGPALLDLLWVFCFSSFNVQYFKELMKAYLFQRKLSAIKFWSDEDANFFFTWATINLSKSWSFHREDGVKSSELKKDIRDLEGLFKKRKTTFRILLKGMP